MTKDEKKQVAELISWAVEISVGMQKDWDNGNLASWELGWFHAMWDDRKLACQDSIKELTGVYVPLG